VILAAKVKIVEDRVEFEAPFFSLLGVDKVEFVDLFLLAQGGSVVVEEEVSLGPFSEEDSTGQGVLGRLESFRHPNL